MQNVETVIFLIGILPEEAVSMAIDAKKAWVEVALEEGKNIPEPTNPYSSNYSGKFTLRLPKTLHRELALLAEDEGVSLNQYLLYLIAKGLNKETSAQWKDFFTNKMRW